MRFASTWLGYDQPERMEGAGEMPVVMEKRAWYRRRAGCMGYPEPRGLLAPHPKGMTACLCLLPVLKPFDLEEKGLVL